MHSVHHTSEVVQSSLLRSPGFWLPTLLAERRCPAEEHIALASAMIAIAPASAGISAPAPMEEYIAPAPAVF